jgi:hypothetical protein
VAFRGHPKDRSWSLASDHVNEERTRVQEAGLCCVSVRPRRMDDGEQKEAVMAMARDAQRQTRIEPNALVEFSALT